MLIPFAIASLLVSGEIEFPNECVLAYSEKDSVQSWGGYNYNKAFLDTAQINYYDPLDKYLFKKDMEPAWSVRFVYRYWIIKDYCVKLEQDMVESKAKGADELGLGPRHASVEIIKRNGKSESARYTVVGTDAEFLYLEKSGDYRGYRVRKWFSEAIKLVIHDAEKQMEFDIAEKSQELIKKIKEKE